MTRGSKEFYEVRDQFEKDFRRWSFCRGSLDRADEDSPTSVFYQNGEVNGLFHAYMSGFAFSNAKSRL